MPDLHPLTDLAVERMLSEHALLYDLLEESEHITSDVDSWDSVLIGIQELRQMIYDDFASQEKEGYLRDAVVVAPRFTTKCQTLRNEHRLLLSELDAILDELNYGPNDTSSSIHQRFLHFVKRYLKHEEDENTLVQTAFLVDLGCGD